MDIQNPFQFVWEKTTFTNFSDFIFSKISKYGSQPALVRVFFFFTAGDFEIQLLCFLMFF